MNVIPKTCDPLAMARLIRQGDMDGLDRLTRCFGQRLLAVGRRHCANEDAAQDAVQDALTQAAASLTEFRGDGSVEGWLVRMVARACYRMRRGRKNNPAWHVAVQDAALADPAADPEAAAAQGHLASFLGDALFALPPVDRAILLMADAEGWKGPEIAEALDMTPEAVRARLSRVRRKLRRTLAPLREAISD